MGFRNCGSFLRQRRQNLGCDSPTSPVWQHCDRVPSMDSNQGSRTVLRNVSYEPWFESLVRSQTFQRLQPATRCERATFTRSVGTFVGMLFPVRCKVSQLWYHAAHVSNTRRFETQSRRRRDQSKGLTCKVCRAAITNQEEFESYTRSDAMCTECMYKASSDK